MKYVILTCDPIINQVTILNVDYFDSKKQALKRTQTKSKGLFYNAFAYADLKSINKWLISINMDKQHIPKIVQLIKERL